MLNTRLLKIDGTKGTYTQSNYPVVSSHNYIVKKDTQIIVSNKLGDTPSESSDSLYKGVAVSNNTTLNTDNIIINSNDIELNAYYDRTEFTISAKAIDGVNGIKITNNSSSNSITSTLTDNNKSIIVRYGSSITAQAVLLDGQEFVKWSGISDSTQNPLTITPRASGELSVVLNQVQNEKPNSEIENIESNLKATSVNFKIKCSDEVKVAAYYFGTNNNPSDSDFNNISGNNKNFEKNQSVNLAGTYY